MRSGPTGSATVVGRLRSKNSIACVNVARRSSSRKSFRPRSEPALHAFGMAPDAFA